MCLMNIIMTVSENPRVRLCSKKNKMITSSELRLSRSACRLYFNMCMREYEQLLSENDIHVQNYNEHVHTGNNIHAPVEDYNFRLEALRQKIHGLWITIRTADILLNECGHDYFSDDDIHECRVRAMTEAEFLTE